MTFLKEGFPFLLVLLERSTTVSCFFHGSSELTLQPFEQVFPTSCFHLSRSDPTADDSSFAEKSRVSAIHMRNSESSIVSWEKNSRGADEATITTCIRPCFLVVKKLFYQRPSVSTSISPSVQCTAVVSS